MRKHVVECPDWLALPTERQLEPEPEYLRWQEQDRDADRDRRRELAIEATETARAAAGERFARSRDLDAELDELEVT